MPDQKNENNFTWKHLLAIVSIIGFVVTFIISGFALLETKADQSMVIKIAEKQAEKAEKTDVIRMEDHIEKQIVDVKKDLKEDIGEVKKKVDDIYKAVSGGR